MSGSPDRTSFATFVCLRKLRMYVTNWKKSLEYANKKIDRTSDKEVLPMLLSGSPNVRQQLEPNYPRYAQHL